MPAAGGVAGKVKSRDMGEVRTGVNAFISRIGGGFTLPHCRGGGYEMSGEKRGYLDARLLCRAVPHEVVRVLSGAW